MARLGCATSNTNINRKQDFTNVALFFEASLCTKYHSYAYKTIKDETFIYCIPNKAEDGLKK